MFSFIFFDKDVNQSKISEITEFSCEITDFEIKLLAEDIVLATYKAIKHHELRIERKYSLRSSIWKCFSGQWKLVFHQGTPTKEY